MKIRVIYFVMLFLCVAAAQSEPVLKGGPEELKSYLLKENYRTISIRGDAEKYIPVEKPEIAILVKTEDYEFKRALEKNKKVRGAVRERLVRGGIKDKDVKSSKFSSTPSYGIFGKTKKYEVKNEVRVILNAEDELIKVAGVIDDIEEASYLRIEQNTPIGSAIKNEIMIEAIKSIKDKAKIYERELGIKLLLQSIKEIEFSENEEFFNQPMSKLSDSSIVSSFSKSYSQKSDSFGEEYYKITIEAIYLVK